MKKVTLLILFSFLISALFISGCKKNDDSAQPNQNLTEYQAKTISIPDVMAQSNDEGAQMAVAYINMVNNMTNYAAMLNPPGKTTMIHYKNGGEETYTWEVDDQSGKYTVTLKIRKFDNKTTWDMYVTGTLDGHQLTNFKYISATQQNDNTSGTFIVYDLDTGNQYMDITWSDDGQGNVELTFTVFEEIKLYISVSSNGSGMLEYSEWRENSFWLTYKAQWESSGHGWWWEYDNGNETDSGSW